jgi:hypothetical protein
LISVIVSLLYLAGFTRLIFMLSKKIESHQAQAECKTLRTGSESLCSQ